MFCWQRMHHSVLNCAYFAAICYQMYEIESIRTAKTDLKKEIDMNSYPNNPYYPRWSHGCTRAKRADDPDGAVWFPFFI